MKKIITALAVTIAIVAAGCTKQDDPQPEVFDNIVVYGKIYTARIDSSKAKDMLTDTAQYVIADAMVIKDGKFICVGTKDEANKHKTEKSRIIDCTGKGIIIPGITDGHAHYLMKFINEQMSASNLQFRGDWNYQQVLDQVRDFVNQAKQDGRHLDYVYGEGYSLANLMENGHDLRHRKDLDAISTEIPIFLTGFDHHSTVVNTRAMINADILDENGNVTRDRIAGGFMYRDEEGKLNGVFAERAISLL
ncbi:MAG: amidohydrolase family protein, partial [Bacteroidales bacterium]|nr:amidohydrolase family protein [Bacteroidales bacterium]